MLARPELIIQITFRIKGHFQGLSSKFMSKLDDTVSSVEYISIIKSLRLKVRYCRFCHYIYALCCMDIVCVREPHFDYCHIEHK